MMMAKEWEESRQTQTDAFRKFDREKLLSRIAIVWAYIVHLASEYRRRYLRTKHGLGVNE